MRISTLLVDVGRRVLLAGLVALACILLVAGAAQAQSAGKVLVFHGTVGTVDPSVDEGVAAIEALGADNGFGVDATGDAGAFTATNLAQYRAVVFLHSSGDVLSAAQAAAFQDYVAAGGGFLGIGNAAGVQPSSGFFTDLIGARPAPGSPTAPAEGVVGVGDRLHPATKSLPIQWTRTDTWFNWAANPTGQVHTLARVRAPGAPAGDGSTDGPDRPVAWCRDVQGGRSLYTAMGRTPGSYAEADFRKLLLGAIQWTAGLVRGGCKATIASSYRKEKLTRPNASGDVFDQIGEPHGLSIAPDGRVIYIGRGGNSSNNPATKPQDWADPNIGKGFGTIHVWDPRASGSNPEKVTTAAILSIFGNRGSAGELVKTEEGGLGITLAPDFMQTGHVFVYWMPHATIDRPNRIGMRRVSRFTLNLQTNQIDVASEKVIVEWPTQIHSCCHAGGGMGWDSEGNLYVTTGDSNSSGFSNGYSGNNPMTKFTEGPGGAYSYSDARATAGNTNDLNGKMLRIKPLANPGSTPGIGSTYDIPAGPNGANLFTGNEEGGGKSRREIYAMGLRNPSRLWVDQTTNWVYTAWVGPDANGFSATQGPAQYESATVIPKAGNYGWPYCMGNKQPYRDRSDQTTLLGWYNCDAPVNESPNNIDQNGRKGGMRNLPPVTPVNIWYSPGTSRIQGGCPTFRRGADNIPIYSDDGYERSLCPWAHGGGGQAVMTGPLYRYPANADASVAWPRYWTGRWFLYDVANVNNIRHALLMDPDTAGTGGQPQYVDSLKQILTDIGPGNYGLMDGKFGPDGAFYLLNYGGGFFNYTPNSALWRVTYAGGPDTPGANPKGAPIGGRQVRFSSAGSGGVSYEWSFGDGSPVETGANPTHTYTATGTYRVTLTVTYADGDKDAKTIEVQALEEADTQAPVTTAALDPVIPGPGGTYTRPVTVRLHATDAGGSGLDKTEYRVNGGAFKAYDAPFTVSDDASYTIEFRSADKAGNTETLKSVAFKIDRTATQCDASGISDEFNGTTLDPKWQVLRPNNDARSFVGGRLRMLVRAGDMIGGTATAQNLVLQNAPRGSWTATTKLDASQLTNGGEQAGLVVWQSESPNNFVKIVFIHKPDGVEWFEYVLTQNDGTVRLPNTGALQGVPNDVYIRASSDGQAIRAWWSFSGRDDDWHQIGDPITGLGPDLRVGLKVSNNADSDNGAAFDWFHVACDDVSPPTTAAAVDPATPNGKLSWYSSAPRVTLTANDGAGAGVDRTEYRIGEGEWTAYREPFAVTEDGLHRVQYRSTDEEGNAEAAKTITVKVDRNTPTTEATVDPAGTVKLQGDDGDGSGVDFTEYRVDGGDWKTSPKDDERIFDGTEASLSKWTQAPGGSFTLQPDGSIQSTGGLGMLWYPEKAYGDFSLRFQWRDARTGDGHSNSGAFVRFPDPRIPLAQRPPGSCGTVGNAQTQPAWVAIFCGHEIQMYDGPTGEPQKTGSIYNFQPLNLEQGRVTPKGDWNDYEIRVVGQQYTIIRNGVVINEFDNAVPRNSSRGGDPPTQARQFDEGYIGLQNHGNSDVTQIRDVRVQDLAVDTAEELTVTGRGEHKVEFRSIDAAGNAEEAKSVTFRIGSDGGSPPPGASPGAPDARPAPPLKAPTIAIGRLKKTTLATFLRRGVKVTVQCSTPGMRGTARLEVSRRDARRLRLRGLVVASRSVVCGNGRTVTATLKATKKAKRALRKARSSVTATVRVRMSTTRTTVSHSRRLVLRASRR